jgi:hypothetical protein
MVVGVLSHRLVVLIVVLHHMWVQSTDAVHAVLFWDEDVGICGWQPVYIMAWINHRCVFRTSQSLENS